MNIWRVDTFYTNSKDTYEVAAQFLFQAKNEPTKEQITAWFAKNCARDWPNFRIIGPIPAHTL